MNVGNNNGYWSNVGPGKYYFVFNKAKDTYTVYSNSVRMFS